MRARPNGSPRFLLPAGFERAAAEIRERASAAAGHLKDREVAFLVLLAAAVRAPGEVLEIGSYKGKSTVVLARASMLAATPGVVAVDPLTAGAVRSTARVSGADPDSVRTAFYANLDAAGVADQVEFHETFSHELARAWTRPLRLLWIDGDHGHAATKRDFELFRPFLRDGAVVALHDALSPFEGPCRVFAEDVLASDDFGACGFCGSIAWAVRETDPERGRRYRADRVALARRLSRLLPFVRGGARPRGLARIVYKVLRSRIPHGQVDPSIWLARVEPRRELDAADADARED